MLHVHALLNKKNNKLKLTHNDKTSETNVACILVVSISVGEGMNNVAEKSVHIYILYTKIKICAVHIAKK